jgi:hypothetical protein
MKIKDIVQENVTQGKITPRQQQATVGVNKFTDGKKWNSDYTLYRLGLALASTNGADVPPDIDYESWIGKWKLAMPYTKEEQDMLNMAYKAVNAEHVDLNHGDLVSQELKSTNKTSPIAKPKKNKYGV